MTIVRAAAKGIAKVMDRNRLANYGCLPHYLWHDQNSSVLKQMDFTKRRNSTQGRIKRFKMGEGAQSILITMQVRFSS